MPSISRIIIDQQYAAIGIRSTPARLVITTPRPQMEVVQEKPEMTVDRQTPSFQLDWKQVRSESGLMLPYDLALTLRDDAKGKVADYTVEAVHDGDFLGKVEQPGNRVAQLSRQKTLAESAKELNLGTMPQSLPKIEWDPGFIKINWSNHQFKIEWDREYMPDVVVDPPYSLEIFLRNKPYIKIIVEDAEESMYYGKHIDKKL